MNTLEQKLRKLSSTRRRRIEARAAELIADEMSLRELRQAHEKTQVRVAEALGIGQDGVSRLEQRSDLLISTLRDYVQAVGGDLELVARFPDRNPVILSGFAAMSARPAKASVGRLRAGRKGATRQASQAKRAAARP